MNAFKIIISLDLADWIIYIGLSYGLFNNSDSVLTSCLLSTFAWRSEDAYQEVK